MKASAAPEAASGVLGQAPPRAGAPHVDPRILEAAVAERFETFVLPRAVREALDTDAFKDRGVGRRVFDSQSDGRLEI